MRTSLAMMSAITFLFVGVIAVSESAQQAEPTINSSSANSSYQAGVGVFEGIATTGASGIVYFGIAAIVLVALGLLVASSGGGR